MSTPASEVCGRMLEVDIGPAGQYANCRHTDLHYFCERRPDHAGNHWAEVENEGQSFVIEWAG